MVSATHAMPQRRDVLRMRKYNGLDVARDLLPLRGVTPQSIPASFRIAHENLVTAEVQIFQSQAKRRALVRA